MSCELHVRSLARKTSRHLDQPKIRCACGNADAVAFMIETITTSTMFPVQRISGDEDSSLESVFVFLKQYTKITPASAEIER